MPIKKNELEEAKELGVVVESSVAAPQFSTNELMQMLLKTQADLAKSQQALSEAILESRKPYVDPAVLAQKKADLVERQKMIAGELRMRENRKLICGHVRDNNTPNIKWMEHSNGILKGVCGSCFAEFDARNPEDLKLLRSDMKSIRNMGRAGAHARRAIGVA